jgi:hypothetical protein
MEEAARLRRLEAECRQRALGEPQKKWYWLAQAAKYQVQADQELAFHSDECDTADSNAPEIKLAQWLNGRDGRRSMEPVAKAEQLDGFFHPEAGLQDRRQQSPLTAF